MKGFRSALSFLSVLGGASDPLPIGLKWFPAVGLVLGGITGGMWWLTAQWWPPAVAAAVALLTDLLLTGMLHFDGLADSSDGLLPHMTRERRLQVMRSPEVGAFALTVVGGVLLARHAGFSSQPASILLVIALMMTSRAFIGGVIGGSGMARPEGIGHPFRPHDGAGWFWPTVASLTAAGLAWLAVGPVGVVAVSVSILAAAAVIGLARRRIGGWTGDVLGASIVIAETVGLMTASF